MTQTAASLTEKYERSQLPQRGEELPPPSREPPFGETGHLPVLLALEKITLPRPGGAA